MQVAYGLVVHPKSTQFKRKEQLEETPYPTDPTAP